MLFLNWLGTKTFIANSTISGVAIGYLAIHKNPLAFLVLLLWLTTLITWAEYRSALANM